MEQKKDFVVELYNGCKIGFTMDDINNICNTAFEDGIGHWAKKVTCVDKQLGSTIDDQIYLGGAVNVEILQADEVDDNKYHILDGAKLKAGIAKWLEDDIMDIDADFERKMNAIGDSKEIDGTEILEEVNFDSVAADLIIQYALFEELVFS